jgi:hypothetical protein
MKLLKIIGIVFALGVPAAAIAAPSNGHVGSSWMCCDGGCCPWCDHCPLGMHK